MQNGYTERSDDRLRDERFNEHWMTSLVQTRDVISEWLGDCTEVRSHSSYGRFPPAQF